MTDPEPQDDELLLTDVVDGEHEQIERGEQEADDDDIVLEGEEEEPAVETELQKKLRATTRDALRDKAALQRELDAIKATQNAPVEVGNMPTLESCEYDEEKFNAEYQAWNTRKAQADRIASSTQSAEQARQRQLQDLEVSYRTSATRLAPSSAAMFEEADKTVRAALGDDAPKAIAGFFKEPAKIIVALYKYPSRLQAIVDEPVNEKKLLLLKEVEMALKSSSTRRAAPPPESETIQRGSAPLSATSDKHLAALEKKAATTGNRSELIAYKAKLAEKRAA